MLVFTSVLIASVSCFLRCLVILIFVFHFLHHLNFFAHLQEATMLFNEVDKDEKGGIDYEAFLALIRVRNQFQF